MMKFWLSFFAVAFLWGRLFIAQASSIELPELGDTSATYLSAEKEKELKQEFMSWIYRKMRVIETPEISEYINDLGYKLVAHSDKNTQDFYFFVVQDKSINAFAGPGGVIGVHSGLIEAAKDEDELAAVLAHEIAHVTQRHLARTYEAVSKSSLPTAAAILAAIIIGSQNQEAGQATLIAAIAGGVQGQINFTRENEKEADAVGIRLLANAGFNPEGMSSFFERLKRQSGGDAFAIPEILRTHPLPVSRIAQARARISQFETQEFKHQDNINFSLFKTKITALQSDQLESTNTSASSLTQSETKPQSKNEVYASVLNKNRQGDYAEAIKSIEKLLSVQPLNTFYQVANVNAYWGLDDYKKADDLLSLYINKSPESQVLKYYSIKSKIFLKQPEKALDLLDKVMRDNKRTYFYPLWAQAKKELGDEVGSHVILADYLLEKGMMTSAIEQLTIAMRKAKKPDEKSRLEKRLQKLQKKTGDITVK